MGRLAKPHRATAKISSAAKIRFLVAVDAKMNRTPASRQVIVVHWYVYEAFEEHMNYFEFKET
jgi:hypothetical protein